MSNPQLFEQIFQLRLTSKMLERSAKKAEKEGVAKKKKVAEYVKKGELEMARVYAQDAIRKKNEALNFLRLAARVDGAKSRLETMQANQKLVQQLAVVSKAMEQSTKSMNVLEVAKVMDRYSSVLEDVSVMEDSIADSIDKSTATLVKQNDVDDLIRQVADEFSLEVHSLLPDLGEPAPAARVPAQQQKTTQTTRALYS
eukprot:TRINITY_DN4440_c0_g1_i1.p1 TRINITY_DN4440_c0_g1~~TRINITY_DN4440_c0_g1_i1.p1  ORF type:complete len:209 (-),score=54.83 TRINITY_DN4440_c0_g1_i1:53-649(-)